MDVDGTLKLVQALSGLTVTGLLFLILIAGHRGKFSFQWQTLRERELATKTEARLEAQIEIERRDKSEWKALALKVTGLAEATVDLAKQKGTQ